MPRPAGLEAAARAELITGCVGWPLPYPFFVPELQALADAVEREIDDTWQQDLTDDETEGDTWCRSLSFGATSPSSGWIGCNCCYQELRCGGGVDAAVHAAAGPRLLKACRPLAPCPLDSAVVTPAFDLAPVPWVIHAIGPKYRGRPEDPDLLVSAYRRRSPEPAR